MKQEASKILLFASSNLVGLGFFIHQSFLEGEKGQGIMWECPDFFLLDGKWLFDPVSIEKWERQQEKYRNLN
ncbi:MAG: hypothetical protein ACLT8H_05485 [Streptococcus parasanguinis]